MALVLGEQGNVHLKMPIERDWSMSNGAHDAGFVVEPPLPLLNVTSLTNMKNDDDEIGTVTVN